MTVSFGASGAPAAPTTLVRRANKVTIKEYSTSGSDVYGPKTKASTERPRAKVRAAAIAARAFIPRNIQRSRNDSQITKAPVPITLSVFRHW